MTKQTELLEDMQDTLNEKNQSIEGNLNTAQKDFLGLKIIIS